MGIVYLCIVPIASIQLAAEFVWNKSFDFSLGVFLLLLDFLWAKISNENIEFSCVSTKKIFFSKYREVFVRSFIGLPKQFENQ